MKIGETEFKLDTNTAIDVGIMAANIGIDCCFKKVIKEMIKHSLPEPVGIGQKVIFKVGEYAFTAAIGTVVAEKLAKAGEYAKAIRAGYLEAINGKKENNENGSSEPETEQQQVQEG